MRSPSTRHYGNLVFTLTTLLSIVASASAQIACQNFGIPSPSNSSACLCPPGFGSADCSLPGCGGTIFQGQQRPLAQPQSSSSPFANLTASNCNCEDGWTGTGCNVCTTASACQTAQQSVGGGSSGGGGSIGGTDVGLNQTLVCSNSPRVFAAGQMSCQVNNPTLQAIYPGSTTLNILRSLQPNLTPLPNTTAFGGAGSVFAHLWYDGVEQFFCTADSCVQDVKDDGGADFDCQNLRCRCRDGTTFCGATPGANLTNTLNGLTGTLSISCDSSSGTTECSFVQDVLKQLFGANGLSLSSCTFGECVAQSVIDDAQNNGTGSSGGGEHKSSLSGGVIAGLAVVGALVGLAIFAILLGLWRRRKARREGAARGLGSGPRGGVTVKWEDVSYAVEASGAAAAIGSGVGAKRRRNGAGAKVVLDHVSGSVAPGQMMAILGPSGAGKTTLLEILAGKEKGGRVGGRVDMPLASDGSVSASVSSRTPRIAFVPQQDVLPPLLTVHEALLFAARLRTPEHIPTSALLARVDALISQLGLERVRNQRIGSASGGGNGGAGGDGGGKRGLSGGEMRRVSIGLELVGEPDVVLLDEPTSGLDAVSAGNVARVLRGVADGGAGATSIRGVEEGREASSTKTAVIATIHQPSSGLYRLFDRVAVLAHGRALYVGEGGMEPVRTLQRRGVGIGTGVTPNPSNPNANVTTHEWTEGYNVADWLLEVASEEQWKGEEGGQSGDGGHGSLEKVSGNGSPRSSEQEKHVVSVTQTQERVGDVSGANGFATSFGTSVGVGGGRGGGGGGAGESVWRKRLRGPEYATTFLTQFETLAGREWKILRRDKTLFVTHVLVSAVLGVFCGGLYFNTDTTIAGFQSRVGCLFFLGALIAFSSLSALYNVVESRSLFLRERSNAYYRPSAWLLSRLIFDMIPLRIIPTIIVSTITYWMAGLSPAATNFFKFLFILVLYSIAMTLFNFLLGCFFRNGGVAILLSALSALYQMTFAGFFVHLADIPPVLRWLQWLCPLKYCLEALSVNEVGSGLMIQDTLQGVPVNVSASLIMQLLFGFGLNNYYRDVLVLFAFIAGFGVGVILIVWFKVQEQR